MQIHPIDGGNRVATFDLVPKVVKGTPQAVRPKIEEIGGQHTVFGHDMRHFLGDEQQYIAARWKAAMKEAGSGGALQQGTFKKPMEFPVRVTSEDLDGKKYESRWMLQYFGLRQHAQIVRRR